MEQEVFSIDDLCSKITDGSHFSPENILNGKYPMFSVKDMDYNGFKSSDYKTIDQITYNKLCKSDCRPLKNDILIAKDGSYLKHAFRVKEDMNACILSSIAILRPNIDKINPDYFVYLLRSASIKSSMANYVSGAALPRIILKAFKKMKIKLIKDRLYQDKIASILSTYDDLIEKNNRKIQILQDMAEELYKEWFVRRGKSTWDIVRLKEFGYSIESGNRPKGGIDSTLKEGVPSLGAESIDKLGVFDYSNPKLIPYEFFQKMKKGIGKDKDILLYKDGAYIGKVTLFMNEFPYKEYAVNEHVFLIRANKELYQYFLYYTLNQPQYFTQMQNLNRNAAQPGLTPKDLNIIKLCKPDEDTVIRFNNIIEPILYNIFSLSKQNNLLKQQRDLLLPRLMSGKLEVKVS